MIPTMPLFGNIAERQRPKESGNRPRDPAADDRQHGLNSGVPFDAQRGQRKPADSTTGKPPENADEALQNMGNSVIKRCLTRMALS